MSRRKLSPLEYNMIAEYAESGLTDSEIVTMVGLPSVGWMGRDSKAARLVKQGRQKYQAKLRLAQLQTALGQPYEYERDADGQVMRDSYGRPIVKRIGTPPNADMLKFLGKNVLGQADRQELTGKNGLPIQTEKQTIFVFPETNLPSSNIPEVVDINSDDNSDSKLLSTPAEPESEPDQTGGRAEPGT